MIGEGSADPVATGDALYEAGRFEEAVEAWTAELASGYDRKKILRAAATAWHRLSDVSRVVDLLGRLNERDRRSVDVRLLGRTIEEGGVERVRKYVRLGLRKAAYTTVLELLGSGICSERTRQGLLDIVGEELCSPWVRMLREKIRFNTGLSFRMNEKDSPVWKLLRKARANVDGDGGDFDDGGYDSPGLLPRVRKETALLRWMEDIVMRRERRAYLSFSPERFLDMLEDAEGLREFERLLARVRAIVDVFAEYSEGTHVEVKDYIFSFLPGKLRDKVCNDEYLDVIRMENELERELGNFVDSRYPGVEED